MSQKNEVSTTSEDTHEKVKEALTKMGDMAFHLSKVVECIMLIYGLIQMESIKPSTWDLVMQDFSNSHKFIGELIKGAETKETVN